MLIPGHIGFTFGAFYLLTRLTKKIALTPRNLCIVAFTALIPDIADKSLHLFFPRYPDHAIFHSMFIYSIFTLFFIIVKKWKALLLTDILFLHCFLDLVNNPPGSLVYPLTGFIDRRHFYPPVGVEIVDRLPEVFSVKDFTGHYLLFEIPGLILIILVSYLAWRKKKLNLNCSSEKSAG